MDSSGALAVVVNTCVTQHIAGRIATGIDNTTGYPQLVDVYTSTNIYVGEQLVAY